jgi:branched-chain amino acid transport system permease protein
LSGLYLALATLAFAQAMDLVFFQNSKVFGFGGKLPVGRMVLFGIHFDTDRSFIVLLAIVFGLLGAGVLALRRGPFGRRLSAMSNSPAACATLGMNTNSTKLAVFVLSAAMAGLAGAFFGGLKTSVGPGDFELLQSLIFLLLIYIGGINTVSGALMGGMFFAMFPVLQEHVSFLRSGSTQYLLTGLAAMSLGRNPNGVAGQLADLGDRVRALLRGRRVTPTADGEEVRLAGAPG